MEEDGSITQLVEEEGKYTIENVELGERTGFSRLTIMEVQPLDSGEYVCRAMNDVGTNEATTTLEVHGKRFALTVYMIISNSNQVYVFYILPFAVVPIITFPTADYTYTVNQSDSVVFECTATGIPPPTIIWLRDLTALNELNDPRIIIRDPTQSVISTMSDGDIYLVSNNLTLINTMDSDSDTYTCLAVNGDDRVQSVAQDFDLVVQGRV